MEPRRKTWGFAVASRKLPAKCVMEATPRQIRAPRTWVVALQDDDDDDSAADSPVVVRVKCSSTLDQSSEHSIHQKDGEASVVRVGVGCNTKQCSEYFATSSFKSYAPLHGKVS